MKSFSGKVISIFSLLTFSIISLSKTSFDFFEKSSESSFFELFILAAKFFLSSGDNDPSFLNSRFIIPFLPNISELILVNSDKFFATFIFSLNSNIFFQIQTFRQIIS